MNICSYQLTYYLYSDVCDLIANTHDIQFDNDQEIQNWRDLEFKKYCRWLWTYHGVNYHSIKEHLNPKMSDWEKIPNATRPHISPTTSAKFPSMDEK